MTNHPRQLQKRTDICIRLAAESLRRYEAVIGTLRPPIPIEDLAQWHEFQVVRLGTLPQECSALVSLKDRLIGVNAKHHPRRQRFSIAHELAHVLLNHPPETKCTSRQIAVFNAEADECAAELLMPEKLIRTFMAHTSSLSGLALLFDVSEEAVGLKLKRLDLMGNPSTGT